MSDTEQAYAKTEIAIVGMSGRFPAAPTLDQFWANLRDGIESVTLFTDQQLLAAGIDPGLLHDPRYVKAGVVLPEIELFDAAFFGINAREAALMDPQHRLFLECAWEAIERAGYDTARYPGAVGVYVGVSMNTYVFHNLYPNRALIESVGLYQTMLGNDKDFLPTRVSYKLDLTGPSLAVQTGCSSSLVAVHVACQSLINGECDMALAGGATVSLPQGTGYLYEPGGIHTSDGHCRAFDAQAEGTISGSGVGVVALKRLDDAIADGDQIYAVIKGTAVNNDGASKAGYTAPSVSGQARVIEEAHAIAGVDAETIGYVETHGTGTPIGDPIEIDALTRAFRVQTDRCGYCAIGSVKTNIGHLDATAGIAGLIKTVLALQHKQIPPSLNYEQPNPQINFADSPFFVNTQLREWTASDHPRRAGVSAFGVGGTNAHVILEEAPRPQPRPEAQDWQLLVLSARTPTALHTAGDRLAQHLQQHPLRLDDVACTLQLGRRVFNQRRAIVCRDRAEAITALKVNDPQRVMTAAGHGVPPQVALLFPGQGSQYPQMGRELFETEPVFRNHIAACAQLLQPLLHAEDTRDLREILYPATPQTEDGADRLQQTLWAQPALFAVEYALAQLWMSWGIQPQALVGHSIGEYVAACLAGVLSLPDALTLVACRAQLMQQLPPGAMLVIEISAEEVYALIGDRLDLAAINAPKLAVVSGPADAIEELTAVCAAKGISHRRLRTSHAFHSRMMDPMLSAFAGQVRQIQLHPPRIPYLSNLTGTWITAEQATDPQYWVQHLRQPVRFADCIRELAQASRHVLLEAGPGRTLAMLARQQTAADSGQLIITSLRHPQSDQSDRAHLLTAVAKLWLADVPIAWQSLHHEPRYRVPLPTYPFERQRYWVDPPRSADLPLQTGADALPAEYIDPSRPDAMSTQSPGVSDQPGRALEQHIAAVFQHLLGIPRVGLHDDFFELGGHSLLATQLIARLRDLSHVELPMQSMYDTPSVAGLARRIELLRQGSSDQEERAVADEIAADLVLDPAIQPAHEFDQSTPNLQHILLTGATGYLGTFLLHELLQQTEAVIWCVVRAGNLEAAAQRLRSKLEQYRLWNEEFASRIRPVLGDLSQPLLGMSDAQFEALAEQIDVIYHNGALVNFVYPYHILKPTNVSGSVEIIRFACAVKTKPVHYISSVAVFDGQGDSIYHEDDSLERRGHFFTGYAQSKWIAEHLMQEAQRRGLPITVYRPGNISGHSQSGVMNTEDFLFRMLKGSIQLGVVPAGDGSIDITPVDYVSKALVYLSLHTPRFARAFHLVNPQPTRFAQIVDWLRGFGYQLETVPTDQWQAALTQMLETNAQDNVLYPLLAMLRAPEAAVMEPSVPQHSPGVQYDCRHTLSALADTAIKCPAIDDGVLQRYLNYLIASGYLAAPNAQDNYDVTT